MVVLDQSTWNLLFGWMTGRQCFLPEGCTLPMTGVLVYAVILAGITLLVWKRDMLRDRFLS